jgi:hypothetical protein
MKQMNRLMVTSDTYKLASWGDKDVIEANRQIDPGNAYLSSFRLLRLEAEPIWDSILYSSNNLDQTIGGPSFDLPAENQDGRRGARGRTEDAPPNRRGVYMVRGFSTSRDMTPHFLQSFDVEDGRAPCPMRTSTVTAPQGLFMMNSSQIEAASIKLAERLQNESKGDLPAAVNLGYSITLGREPSAAEKDFALTYLENDPARFKGLAWLLYNLDEFVYVQ